MAAPIILTTGPPRQNPTIIIPVMAPRATQIRAFPILLPLGPPLCLSDLAY